MATAKDIAAKLGISPSAVSIAFNNKLGISDETRKLIIKTASELGYSPKVKKKETKKNIQLVVFSDYLFSHIDDNSFMDEVTEGISYTAQQLGYMLYVTYITADNLKEQYQNILQSGCNGIILLASKAATIDPVFCTDEIPTVILDRPSDSFYMNSVSISNYQGIRIAVDYLYSIGHRTIAYVGPETDAANFVERRNAFRIASFSHPGMEASLNNIYLLDNMADGKNNAELIEEIVNSIAASDNPPTGFVCATDTYAFTLMSVLKAHNYSIPGDFSVTGFDNMPFSEFSSPTLSTVAVPKRDLGEEAVRRLDYLISSGSDSKARISVLTKLIVRESTGPAKK